MLPIVSRVSVKPSINISVVSTDTTTNGSAVDLKDNNSAMIVFHSGAITDGTFTPTVEESFNGGTNWSEVAAEDLQGTLTDFATASSNTYQSVGYKGKAGQIRAVITSADTDAGGTVEAFAILGNEKNVGGSPIVS